MSIVPLRVLRSSRDSTQSAELRFVRRTRAPGSGVLRALLAICLCWAPWCAQAEPPAVRHGAPTVRSERLAILNKRAPEDRTDLQAIQSQVLKIVDRVRQSTVAIIVGDSQGSGVIVTDDGLVLTAAHVVSAPGRKVTVVLPDGRRVTGHALGVNSAGDSGIVQIADHGTYPACKISDLSTLKVGDWCLASGHPGGYQSGRPPVVRLGRIVAMRENFLQSDCPLLGGDSGGPLFDLNGNVIGIHSRIGPRTTLNLHVSAALFVRDWDKLVKARNLPPGSLASKGMLGFNGEDHADGARVTVIFPRLSADEAGLKPGDIITKFSGHSIQDFETLKKFIQARHPGEIVELHALRGKSELDIRATIVARPTE
jgi:serine protease Do